MRTIYILLAIFVTLVSCKNSGKRKLTRTETQKDSILYEISCKNYIANYRSNSRLYLIKRKNDNLFNILEEGIAPNSIKFEDFDGDRNNDLRYGFSSNFYYEKVWIYMQKEKNFRVIDSIDNPEFANSKKLENSNFYYSYSPNGCGKNNWVSYLFLVVNFKVKPVAYIDYKQCEGDEKGMYLYKFQRGTKLLIEKLDRKESEINDLEFEWKSLMNKIASP